MVSHEANFLPDPTITTNSDASGLRWNNSRHLLPGRERAGLLPVVPGVIMESFMFFPAHFQSMESFNLETAVDRLQTHEVPHEC